jgi:hypothetical protein
MIETPSLRVDNNPDQQPPTPEEKPVRWWEVWLVGLLAWLVLLALIPHILDRLNPPTGDEPFYLTTTISLLYDHDLDETNNYKNRDYWSFAATCEQMSQPNWGNIGDPPVYNVSGVMAPGLRGNCRGLQLPEGIDILLPHGTKNHIPPGTYTKHGLGLSFLIAPAYALGGRPMVVVFLTMLTALLGVNLWLLAFETTGQRRVAWICWVILLFSSPILCYAFLIFPATPAALLVVYSWRRLRLAARAQQQGYADWQPNGPVHALLIGICLGILPWLHSLYLSLTFVLFGYWLWGGRNLGGRWWAQRQGRSQERLSWRDWWPTGWSRVTTAFFFAPLLILGGLFVTYYMWLYGSPLPNTQDHAGFASPLEIPLGLLGLLFDQKYGLLIYGPFYLVALTGLALMWRKTPDEEENAARRSDLFWIAAVSVPYLLVIGDYKQWWGEWCPPARYLMPVLPLLTVPLSLAWCELRKGWLFKVFCGLAAIWTAGVAVLFMYNPHLMFNWQTNRPTISLLWLEYNVDWLAKAGLGRWLPSYVTDLEINGKQPNWLAAIIWVLVALLVGYLLVRTPKAKKFNSQTDNSL